MPFLDLVFQLRCFSQGRILINDFSSTRVVPSFSLVHGWHLPGYLSASRIISLPIILLVKIWRLFDLFEGPRAVMGIYLVDYLVRVISNNVFKLIISLNVHVISVSLLALLSDRL